MFQLWEGRHSNSTTCQADRCLRAMQNNPEAFTKQSAKITIECGTTKVTLKAFNDIIKDIAQSEAKVSEPDLILAPSFNLSYNKFNIITKVSRN